MRQALAPILPLIPLALLALLALAGCGSGSRSDAAMELEHARESFNRGFFLEAEAAYERYLQKVPQGGYRAEAWSRLIEIAQNVKADPERSIALIEAMSLEFASDRERSFQLSYQLGDLYEQQGNRPKALEAFEKALAVAGDARDKAVAAQLRSARIYRSQGNYEQVQETLQNCVKNAPDEVSRATCLYELAQTYTFIQAWDKGKKALEEILTIKDVPQETKDLSVFILADIYEHERDFPKARQLLESIRETYPNPKVVEARLEALGKAPRTGASEE